MKVLLIIITYLFIFSKTIWSQEIPINDLLYQVKDFEFNLSPSGKSLASVKKIATGYSIWITDIETATIKSKMSVGPNYVYNLNWISENRITFEQYGSLYAINIDASEKQQLMSTWKKKKNYFSIKNYQTSRMINVMEDDFEHILLETRGIDDYPIISKLNIFTGEKKDIENGQEYEINQWLVDRNGEIRLGVKNNDDKVTFFVKNKKNEWVGNNQLGLDTDGSSFINKKLNLLDFDYNKNIIYLASSINTPNWIVLSYDIEKKEYVDTILSDEKYDIGNPINEDTELLFLDSEEKLVGIRYKKFKPFTKWFSPKFQAHQDTLQRMYPEYYPEIFDWNKDGTIVLVRLFSDVDPGHIIIYDSEKGRTTRFSSLAQNLLKYKVSYSQRVKYLTRDSYEIEGYLNLPLKYKNNIPFIIMPHGGPWARDYWEYDPIIQFFTNQGFGVFRMNFRGSTGYGVNHLMSGIKNISTLMIDDINDGTKWLIEKGYADKDNMFLYGHSYGGYAALQSLIKYPNLYNAAVSIGAPTDIVELIEYYDDQDNTFTYDFWKSTIGDPDDEETFLEKISPIHNIAHIKKPVFIFHGEKDRIVPVEQTESFMNYAKNLDYIEHKIIKDENHSISENRNVEFVLRKSLQFYKKNMKKK